ncbi:MAG: MucR family transcriptional regulator [Methylorubrum populi]
MSENSQSPELDRIELAADLVSAYVSNNSLPSAELAGLITQVHAALVGLSAPQAPKEEEVERATPAQVKKSITPDALISFIDGKPYKTLKRHLTTHGLDIEGYRRRYGLPTDYPTVSANYSAARSALAKDLGLGQQRRKPSTKAAETADEVVAEAAPATGRKGAATGEGRKTGGRRKAA